MTHIVSYDLRKNRDYDSLYEAIKAYGAWAHIHESVWAIVTNKSATEVRDDLATHIDDDDRIFVIQSSGIAAWRGVICKDNWLKTNL